MSETVLIRDSAYPGEWIFAKVDGKGLVTLEGHDNESVVLSAKQLQMFLEWLQQLKVEDEQKKLAEWNALSTKTA